MGGLASLRVAAWRAGRERDWVGCGWLAGGTSRFRGSLARSPDGRAILRGARRVAADGSETPFGGVVALARGRDAGAPDFGREVEISGRFACREGFRNPGRLADGQARWRIPAVSAGGRSLTIRLLPTAADGPARLQAAWLSWLARRFQSAPRWAAVVRAVWTGDASGLPEPLLQFYRDGGLFHVLALSGQHVHALTALLLALWNTGLRLALRFGRARQLRRIAPRLRRSLPVASAIWLYAVSQAPGPLQRTLAMTVALWCLRRRRLQVSATQLVASSVALLVVIDPALLGHVGFLLSAGATALLCRIIDEGSALSGWRGYVAIGIAMPLLILPLTAYTFAHASPWAWLHNLGIGWSWGILWIPLAFASPFVEPLAPRPIGALLEAAWDGWCRLEAYWRGAFVTGALAVVRPTWIECLLAEALLVAVTLSVFRALFPRAEPRP